MNETANNFWQTHSEKFLEMAFRTDRQEVLRQPDGKGEKTGDCGDTIAFYLMLDGDRIQTISYAIQGCLNTNACANAICEMVDGKTLDSAWEITPEAIAALLQTLPDDHFHCAELAAGAFYLALSDARAARKAPWKKMYR
jgi:nitrogen fixation NifU-like protein